MKKIFILYSVTLCLGVISLNQLKAQNVAINTDGAAPNASAMLDIKSTTKGLLIPRMTTLQRTAIPTPAIGLKVFDLNTRSFHFYNGTKWIEIASVPAINYWVAAGNNVYNNTGYVGIGTNIPASRLHIVGNEAIVPLRIQNKLATGQTAIQFYNSSGLVMGHFGFGNVSSPIFTNSFYAGSTGSAPFIFTTNNLERIRIDITGSVGIGTAATLSPSAILDVKSTSKGLLIPRMTLAQRNLVALPATSLLIFQTDNTPGFYYYNGAGWIPITSGGSTNSWSLNGKNIFNTNTGNAGIGTSNPINKFTVQSAYDSYGITHTDGTIKISTYIGKGGGAWFGTESNHKLHIYTNGNGTPNITFHPDFYTDIRGKKPWVRFYDETSGFNLSGDIRSNGSNLEIAARKGPNNIFSGVPGNLILQAGEPGSIVVPEQVAGNVGIGTITPRARLDVARGHFFYADAGTAAFRGSVYHSYFNLGLDEDTYISGGKNGSNVIINDMPQLGNLGIGTATPAYKLTVRTASGNYGLTHTDGAITVGSYVGFGAGWFGTKSYHPLYFFTNNGSAQMAIETNGHVSIYAGLSIYGLTNVWTLRSNRDLAFPDLAFFHNGVQVAYVNDHGEWVDLSDISFKENISPYKSVLGDIKNLKVSTYRFKSNAPDSRSFGLIAQNVAQYFPEIVSETRDKEGHKLLGIAYGKTGVLALKAIQEQQVIIEKQQQKIDDLEKRLAALEKIIYK